MPFESIVVGGGLCGTLAAQHLALAGHRVLLIEAGPTTKRALPKDYPTFMAATRDLTKVDDQQWAFRAPKGYEWHRVRALGGRTLLWGGWMMRPARDYYRARRAVDAAWPVPMERMDRWVALAEKRLHVKKGKRGPLHRALSRLGVKTMVKHEAVLPKGRRMLTALDLRPPHVREETVLSFESSGGAVRVHLAGGLSLETKRLVLAASPIETARIVETSRGGKARRRIGYADHLLSGVICIVDRQPSPPHPIGEPDQSAVIAPEPGTPHRFTVELRGPAPLEHLDPADVNALGFTPETARTKSFYVVFAMGETDPHQQRIVEFDPEKQDAFGRPAPRFVKRRHTAWEKKLAKAMNETCTRLGKQLAGEKASMYCIYDARDYGSGGHETGTCVDLVDEHGELYEFPGVFLADGSAVPAATDRHPSLTLAANALRVADRAARSKA
jgi:choline dehydrogenase-like flavoprotein